MSIAHKQAKIAKKWSIIVLFGGFSVVSKKSGSRSTGSRIGDSHPSQAYSSRCFLYSQYSGPASSSGQSSWWISPRQASASASQSVSGVAHGRSPPNSHGCPCCSLIRAPSVAARRRTMRHHTPNCRARAPVLGPTGERWQVVGRHFLPRGRRGTITLGLKVPGRSAVR